MLGEAGSAAERGDPERIGIAAETSAVLCANIWRPESDAVD